MKDKHIDYRSEEYLLDDWTSTNPVSIRPAKQDSRPWSDDDVDTQPRLPRKFPRAVKRDRIPQHQLHTLETRLIQPEEHSTTVHPTSAHPERLPVGEYPTGDSPAKDIRCSQSSLITQPWPANDSTKSNSMGFLPLVKRQEGTLYLLGLLSALVLLVCSLAMFCDVVLKTLL